MTITQHVALNVSALVLLYGLTVTKEVIKHRKECSRRQLACKATVVGCCMAAVGETFYGFGIHFFLYSGIVIPSH